MSMNESGGHLLHVSNICMSATNEQIYQLFSFIGRIADFKMYPTDNHSHLSKFTHKFAFVKFEERISVKIAQHLTNTVFIDRALVCVPFHSDTIPDEEVALKCGGPALCGQRQLPPNVVNEVQNLGDGQQMLHTIDPTLIALGLPPYPALSANTDERRVEEIRRTIYVGNLPKECDSNELLWFFNDNVGEVMYLRMASFNDSLPCAYAYIEFTSQPTVLTALQNNGIMFKGRSLRIQHSRVAIVKPERKTMSMALEEVEKAIKVQQDSEKSANVLCKLNQGLAVTKEYAPLWSSNRDRSRSADRRLRSRSRSSDRYWHRSAYHRSGDRSCSANHSHHRKERRDNRKGRRSEAEKNDDSRKRSRSRTREEKRRGVRMSEEEAVDIDPAPSSFSATAFRSRILKKISARTIENQGNEGKVQEEGGGDRFYLGRQSPIVRDGNATGCIYRERSKRRIKTHSIGGHLIYDQSFRIYYRPR